MMVGLFIIMIGILIFVYWILLPVPEKERLLNEVYSNESLGNQSTTLKNYSYPSSVHESLILKNIYLYSNRKEIKIADGYIIGSLIPWKEMNFGSLNIVTDVFSGVKSRKINFFYTNGSGIAISFISQCSGGYLGIKVNDFEVYQGCPKGLQKIIIQPDYLKKGNNLLEFSFYPNSVFSKATFSIDNLKLEYLERSKLNYKFYYQGEKVYLSYDFCPTDPNVVSLYINNLKIPLYSCQNDNLDITSFLKRGVNDIEVLSKVKTRISLSIFTLSNIFYYMFNFTKKEPSILNIVKSEGEGDVYINSCRFHLAAEESSFTYVVPSRCINNGENLLVIRPVGFVGISLLTLS